MEGRGAVNTFYRRVAETQSFAENTRRKVRPSASCILCGPSRLCVSAVKCIIASPDFIIASPDFIIACPDLHIQPCIN
jgi:hypothetical protein